MPSAPPPILAFAEERDLILYDQRASGLSQPALCPEYNDSITEHRAYIARATGAEIRKRLIRMCLESLRQQGIDPNAYTTTTSAMDLGDLRRALGYTRWVLNGSSYGTRLALEAMRADPLGTHAVVLVGPLPPGPRIGLSEALTFQRTLLKLFAACAADTVCHAAFPDPQRDFLALYEELNREPLRVPLANGRDTVVLHGDRLRNGISTMLAGPQFPRIPLILHELRRGDRLRAARVLAPSVDPVGEQIARALNNLVNCHESPGGVQQKVADSLNALLLPPFRSNPGDSECKEWRTTFATERERAPVQSDIPTLILTGEFDARTPTEHGRAIARTLTRAFLYEFPAQAHAGGSACKRDITRQFLDDPTREPNASCIARMPKVSFPTRWPRS